MKQKFKSVKEKMNKLFQKFAPVKEKAEVFIRNNSRYKNFDISFNSLSLVNFIKF